ncbi:MAG TPA: hypothetical protein VG941_00940 [Candidatus Paceibacterota bacterium]|nr:hypothetical protein [Candidatus Paceibacterota bacterium]
MRSELYIEKESWHAKLFFWSLAIWLKFKEGQSSSPEGLRLYYHGTNLCFYIRTIVIWMPMVLALHAALLSAAVYVIVILPFRFFGWSYALFWGFWVLIVGGAFLGGVLSSYFWKKSSEWRRRRRDFQRLNRLKQLDCSLNQGLSGIQVARAWISARKEKICPFISFEKNEEASR